ncbi:unnamed protein product [Durusdinium trenchii]|uniref:Uncharacterized protein n=1 Tax=Durusdinium trenchii TaxID=1381693 RepID=A0ABP0NMT6_9DINO
MTHSPAGLSARSKSSPLTSFLLQESGLGRDSYRKAHELADCVRKEFTFQGYEMRGPVAELVKAGGGGRHRNNVRRDWFRQMGRMDRDHRAPITWVDVPILEYGDQGWQRVQKCLADFNHFCSSFPPRSN